MRAHAVRRSEGSRAALRRSSHARFQARIREAMHAALRRWARAVVSGLGAALLDSRADRACRQRGRQRRFAAWHLRAAAAAAQGEAVQRCGRRLAQRRCFRRWVTALRGVRSRQAAAQTGRAHRAVRALRLWRRRAAAWRGAAGAGSQVARRRERLSALRALCVWARQGGGLAALSRVLLRAEAAVAARRRRAAFRRWRASGRSEAALGQIGRRTAAAACLVAMRCALERWRCLASLRATAGEAAAAARAAVCARRCRQGLRRWLDGAAVFAAAAHMARLAEISFQIRAGSRRARALRDRVGGEARGHGAEAHRLSSALAEAWRMWRRGAAGAAAAGAAAAGGAGAGASAAAVAMSAGPRVRQASPDDDSGTAPRAGGGGGGGGRGGGSEGGGGGGGGGGGPPVVSLQERVARECAAFGVVAARWRTLALEALEDGAQAAAAGPAPPLLPTARSGTAGLEERVARECAAYGALAAQWRALAPPLAPPVGCTSGPRCTRR